MKNNDDQRMRDLTNRLVAMSPEPPPFPEEVTMTTPARKTTMKPLTVFAAAAVVVLLGFGIPFLLLSGGEPPVAGPDTTTTTLVESTTTEPSTTTTPGESTTTTAPGAAYGAEMFVYQSPENSFLDNPALVPLETVVELDAGASDVEVVQASLNLLGNPDLTLPADFMNEVPEGVEALNVRRADGTDNALIIDMNEAFLAGAGGLLADFTMLNQLIYTATQLDGIDEVQFIVGNQQVTEFGSEGLDLSSSVNRETFREGNLALIYLTEPIVLDGDGTVDVIGSSNTFEASVNLRIIDANGEIVHDEFTTATSGSGTWGEYLFSLDESLVTPDSSIQVFDFSAEDGEPENIVTIPVSEGPWALLP